MIRLFLADDQALVRGGLAALLALLVVNNALAEWNLRGLSAHRRLPAEIFAGVGATGALGLAAPMLPTAPGSVTGTRPGSARTAATLRYRPTSTVLPPAACHSATAMKEAGAAPIMLDTL